MAFVATHKLGRRWVDISNLGARVIMSVGPALGNHVDAVLLIVT